MKAKINRVREGKKIIEAPQSIDLYEGDEWIARIEFGQSFNHVAIHTINSDKFKATLHDGQEGDHQEIVNKERDGHTWASVGDLYLTGGYSHLHKKTEEN